MTGRKLAGNRIKAGLAAVLLASSLLVSGCRGLELENKTEQVKGYSRQQAMIVAANERNRYQNVYGSGIWELPAGEEGEERSFGEAMVLNVRSFLEQIKTLNMMAEERGMSVTSQERDAIRTLSETYYNGLTEADRDYIGCSLSDVQTLYTDYFLANKLAAVLISGTDSEISDSEAKIIQIQQIETSSLQKAKALLKLVKIDGSDFETMARRYSETEEIDRTLSRGGEEDIYQRTAFGLDEGQISNIVEMNGLYYIIKCTDGYDEEATLQRKDRLQDAIRSQAFIEEYETYRQEHNIRFSESFWNRLDFSDGTDSRVTNFFELYEEAFPEG